MQGTLHIIPANPAIPQRIIKLDRPVTLEELQTAVGGFIEVISSFDTITRDGQVQLCYAFCDEEGKQRERVANHRATSLWKEAVVRRYGWNATLRDNLVGSIALVTGDSEFMQAL